MSRLLNAGFKRMIKDKLFWICLIALISFGIVICLSQYKDMLEYKIEADPNNIIFISASIIGIVMSIFTCLFVGTDYSDGTIRNKIIIGHTRKAIYFSNFIISATAGVIINTIYMIVITPICFLLFSNFNISAPIFIWMIIDVIFLIIVYSSIFNMITLLCSNKTASAVISLLLIFGLMLISANFLSRLRESEFMEFMTVIDGKNIFETVRNPRYLEGNIRKVYQFIVDFIPTGQGFQITSNIAPNIKILAVYSFVISLIINSIGYFIFNKKDLK